MEKIQKEEWRLVPGVMGYYSVSSFGRVRSEERVISGANGRKRAWPRKHLKLHKTQKGYLYTVLLIDGRRLTFRVHRLVMLVFVGPAPEGMECCHKDGCKTNNNLFNLRYDTHHANALDRRLHETTSTKLVSAQVAKIKQDDRPAKDVAAQHGVSRSCIYNIRLGRTWAWVN